MVLEVALVDVVPGQEDAFAAAYREGRPILAGTPGCRSVRMTRGVESASRFVLLVGLSRIYLGVHYPSDILAGWSAALAWTVGMYGLVFYGTLRPWQPRLRAP